MSLTQRQSNTNDLCHYDIDNLTEKDSKNLLPKNIGSYSICDNFEDRPLTDLDIENLLKSEN